MGELAFAQNPGLLFRPDMDFLLEMLRRYSARMGAYEMFPDLRHLQLELVTSIITMFTSIGQRWARWSANFARNVLDPNVKDRGRFSVIYNSIDPTTGKQPPYQELWADGAFIMLAGSDTSAITMSATLFYVLHNPDVHRRLVQELRSTFASLDEICSGPRLDSCKFMHACIFEAMRVSPPTPRAPWREVDKGGEMIDGIFIPEGYDVGT